MGNGESLRRSQDGKLPMTALRAAGGFTLRRPNRAKPDYGLWRTWLVNHDCNWH